MLQGLVELAKLFGAGVVAAGTTSIVAPLLIARRERRFLRLALAAEIGALVKHFERRRYLEEFEESAKFFENLREEKLLNPFTPPEVRFDFFDIYSANVGRVRPDGRASR
jgi:hypothetical protein